MLSKSSSRIILVALSLLALSNIIVQEVDAGLGGILGLGGKGFGGKKTSEMLVAASILASLISKHRDSQNQNKARHPMHIPVPVPAGAPGGYGGYGSASTGYGAYGGYGLGSSLYGGYPGMGASYGGMPSYGGYGGYGGQPY